MRTLAVLVVAVAMVKTWGCGDLATHSSGPRKEPITLTDDNFEEVITAGKPVLVDFWAAWCGPCRQLSPIVEEVAYAFDGKAVVAKLNVDENPRVAQEYGISSIPALLFFENGELAGQLVGVQSRAAIERQLARLIPPENADDGSASSETPPSPEDGSTISAPALDP